MYNAGFPAEGGAGCDDLTLAHELGHNHGLAHSRREPGAQGTYSWSFGHVWTAPLPPSWQRRTIIPVRLNCPVLKSAIK